MNAALTLAGTLAAGVIAQTVARHLRVPGIIILLLVGVGLGPDGIALIDPSLLGGTMQIIVGFAVAIILFEGGLHLHFDRLRDQSVVLRRLLTTGALATALGGTAAAYYVLNWNWQLSVLFGALIIVTGPTVVTPLLRRIRIKPHLQTILEAEGVLIDPVGAIFAVVALDVVITANASSLVSGLGMLVLKLSFGFAVGLAGGLLLGYAMRRQRLVPNELENIFTLACVIFLFEASNHVLHESGIMTVTIAGMIVGNMKLPAERKLVDFKEQLTTMLIGVLFVLLAANVRLDDVVNLGWQGFLVIILVMIAVRPFNIAVSTYGTDIKLHEKLYLSWLAPRGIVAAAVAALFAEDLSKAGIPGGESLQALVFGVIGCTVLAQGLTAGPLAKILGLQRTEDQGYIVVGTSPLALHLAKDLHQSGAEVVVIDTNAVDLENASKIGLTTIHGNAIEESILQKAHVDYRLGVICATSNEAANLMISDVTRQIHQTPIKNFILLKESTIIVESGVNPSDALLFGRLINFDLWNYRFSRPDAIRTIEIPIQARTTWKDLQESISPKDREALLPSCIHTRNGLEPFDTKVALEKGQVLKAYVDANQYETIQKQLLST